MDSSRPKTISQVVGLDIETTGLTPEEAEIIEVAAIRYDWATGKELARFERLCQPKTPISEFVTSLTGISNDMVAGKPAFKDVVQEFIAFVGDDVIFAHNANFDMGFLKIHGAPFKNPVWDTFKLAATAWPDLASYNLGSLQRFLKLHSNGEHRAVFDIEVTWLLLAKIREQLAGSNEALQKIMHVLGKSGQEQYEMLFTQGVEKKPSPLLDKGGAGVGLELVGVSSILGASGLLEKKLPGFIVRKEQLAMAGTIEKSIEDKSLALIEAGTGTGKTYAYSVPTILYVTKNKKPAFISTHSRYLQDQLINSDLPRLQQALGTDLKIVSLKGKSNYVCSARVASVAQKGTYTPDEAWILIKLILWLDSGGSGDLERINLSHQPYFFVKRISADSERCRLRCKPHTCVYQKARKEAQTADIVVINHALLMQMSASEPRFGSSPLIIDEAHHLVPTARAATTLDFSLNHLSELINSLLEAFEHLPNKNNAEHIETVCEEVKAAYETFLGSIGLFVEQHSPNRRMLLTPTTRGMASWKKLVTAGTEIAQRIHFLKGFCNGLQATLKEQEQPIAEQALLALTQYTEQFERFLHSSVERIQWLELAFSWDKKKPVSGILGDMAQDITPKVKMTLGEGRPVILTSATLSTAQNFEYIKNALGINPQQELRMASSFNYPEQMLLYIIEDSPVPQAASFDTSTAEIIKKIASLLGGKTLGLFTSKAAIKTVFNKINSSLNKEKIKLLAQDITGGRGSMVEKFKKNEKTVLLGTNTFWEGLDVPGEALSAVIIPKLPFSPPDDPVIQSMSRSVGSNAFTKISLPEMLLKLRQGVGRLIRTSTDHGIVVMIDSRFLNASYRDEVLKSFPPARIHIGKKDELLEVATNWFNKK